MKIIVNNKFPFKGYKAMTVWPFIFVRWEYLGRYTDTDDRHEHIHGSQQKEMLLVFFYLWYAIEYLVRLALYRKHKTAYRNISFEQEAYDHEAEVGYLHVRKHFAWVRYMFKKSYERV